MEADALSEVGGPKKQGIYLSWPNGTLYVLHMYRYSQVGTLYLFIKEVCLFVS